MLQSSANNTPRRNENSTFLNGNLGSTDQRFHSVDISFGNVQAPTSSEDGDAGTNSVENRLQSPPAFNAESSQRSSLSPRGTGSTSTYGGLFNATPIPRAGSAIGTSYPDSPTREPRALAPSTGVANHLRSLHLDPGGHGIVDHESPPVSASADESEATGTRTVDDNDHESHHFYNVRNETLPDAPIYNPRLQTVLREVRNQLTELQNSMSGCPLAQTEGSNFYAIYQQIDSLSNFEYSTTRTVGFIGDSGVGKSAVVNSLLDEEGLARSSGDGTACTCVVTEFRHVDRDHPRPFTIVVDFMSDEEVEELLEELLRSFRLYYTDSFREVSSVQEQQEIRAASTRAWETLNSLFRSRRELTHEFLSDQSDNAERSILTHLKEWASAGFAHRQGGGDVLQFTVTEADADGCRDQLDALTTDPRDEDIPAAWPFMKLIRVYLRSPILRTGLVLTDLPGFRDLNFARVRATERYLRHSCDEVFIVTKISRCISDQSIPDIISRCDSNQPLRIICTRSEDVSAEETMRNCPEDVTQRIRQFRAQLRERHSRINNTRTRRRQATGEQEMRLSAEENRLRDDVDTLDLRLSNFLINRRNREVESSLIQKYTDTVRIFCVSNQLYSHHRQDDPERAEAYIRLSGIRELRTYCQSVPADAQFRATAAFLEQQAPAFLGSLNQWALAGSDDITAERAANLRRVLHEAGDVLNQELTSRDSDFTTLRQRINEAFAARIPTTIRDQRAWQNGAIHASQEWRGWHAQTYAAFCRRNGTHETKATERRRCWNDEILNEMREGLQGEWDSIADWLESEEEDIQEKTRNIFQIVSGMLQAHIHLAPQALENLLCTMEYSERCITYETHSVLRNLVESTITIQGDALYGHDSSYVAGLMRPAFGACKLQSGSGSDIRRKDIIKNHLASRQFFADLSSIFSLSHRAMVDEICQSFRQHIFSEVANLTRDLRGVVAEEGELTEAGQYSVLARQLRVKVGHMRSLLDRARRIVEEIRDGEN